MSVPFLDLRAQDPEVGAAVRAAVDEVLTTQQCVLGPAVRRFEDAMAAWCGARHAIGVGSGTDALALALVALGVRPGDRVLTTPFTFFATGSTIARVGATPVFADIDPRSFNLAVDAAAEALATIPGIVGIVPVHLFGRLADLDALAALAREHRCWLLEDAAQAIGARADGRIAGTLGRAGALSFYPTKNLGALGDGGMVLTDDDGVAEIVRRDANHGQTRPYVHASLGLCSRLDAVQAAALAAKLPYLDGWNARRRTVAGWYAESLRARGVADVPDAPIVLPPGADDAHVFHVYCVRARRRDALQARLADAGIATQVYYRTPLHRQPPLMPHAVVAAPLVHSERAADEVLALPIYPQLPRHDVERVADAIAAFYAADCG